MGLAHIALARLAGAAAVIVSEPNPARRELAQRMGADQLIGPLAVDLEKVLGDLKNGTGITLGVSCDVDPALSLPEQAVPRTRRR